MTITAMIASNDPSITDDLLRLAAAADVETELVRDADKARQGWHWPSLILVGDDLAEGKATLPLIHAMAQATPELRARLRTIVETGDTDALPEVLAAIEAAGSLDYSRARALEYAGAAERALAGLGDNDAVAALRGLARYAVERGH